LNKDINVESEQFNLERNMRGLDFAKTNKEADVLHLLKPKTPEYAMRLQGSSPQSSLLRSSLPRNQEGGPAPAREAGFGLRVGRQGKSPGFKSQANI